MPLLHGFKTHIVTVSLLEAHFGLDMLPCLRVNGIASGLGCPQLLVCDYLPVTLSLLHKLFQPSDRNLTSFYYTCRLWRTGIQTGQCRLGAFHSVILGLRERNLGDSVTESHNLKAFSLTHTSGGFCLQPSGESCQVMNSENISGIWMLQTVSCIVIKFQEISSQESKNEGDIT